MNNSQEGSSNFSVAEQIHLAKMKLEYFIISNVLNIKI
jgi:hypothetical protein